MVINLEDKRRIGSNNIGNFCFIAHLPANHKIAVGNLPVGIGNRHIQTNIYHYAGKGQVPARGQNSHPRIGHHGLTVGANGAGANGFKPSRFVVEGENQALFARGQTIQIGKLDRRRDIKAGRPWRLDRNDELGIQVGRQWSGQSVGLHGNDRRLGHRISPAIDSGTGRNSHLGKLP